MKKTLGSIISESLVERFVMLFATNINKIILYALCIMGVSANTHCMNSDNDEQPKKKQRLENYSSSSSSSSSTLTHALNCTASARSNAIAMLKNNNIDISSATTAILFNRLPSELQNHLWDYLRPWKHKRTLLGHAESVLCFVYNPDGSQLATGSWDNSTKLWNPATGQCLLTIGGYKIQRNPDGSQTVINPDGHNGSVYSLAYSPDGRQLATGSSDRSTKIWNSVTGQCLLTIGGYEIQRNPNGSQTVINPDGHKSEVQCLAYSPDGRQLATGSWDFSIKIWNPTTGQCLRTIDSYAIDNPDGSQIVINHDGHKSEVFCIAYNSDGSQLATGSFDRSTKIWNPATGQCLLTIGGYEIQRNPDDSQTAINPDGHKDIVLSIAYSPDGRQFATGSGDKIVKIWKRLASKQELQYIKVRAKKEYKNVLNSVLLRAKLKEQSAHSQ